MVLYLHYTPLIALVSLLYSHDIPYNIPLLAIPTYVYIYIHTHYITHMSMSIGKKNKQTSTLFQWASALHWHWEGLLHGTLVGQHCILHLCQEPVRRDSGPARSGRMCFERKKNDGLTSYKHGLCII